ncbi:MAG: 3-oxoacid CoA-transferase subunit B [Synergistaceae bacterium]|nr:3-oxoacid CoA-transferase subunit B [Synergistaceae bacterium]
MLPELSEAEARERIARRIAAELEDGAIVNLGIGIPQLIPDYVPRGVHIILQTENGTILAGPAKDKDDLRVIDAGGRPISVLPGGCFISSETSFAIMRGGHVDATVLGALQVDQEGSLANWMIPQVRVPGMGGAMDIVAGAKKVYIATRHFDKDGGCKLVKKCTLPLTGRGCVDVIVTEYCVIENTYGHMVVKELADGVSFDELRLNTIMEIEAGPKMKRMEL